MASRTDPARGGLPSVAHINLARGYRGGERQTELLIRELAELGLRQSLIGRRDQPLLDRVADVRGLQRIAVGGLRLAPSLSTVGAVDVLHAHEAKAAHLAARLSLLSGRPYVITRRVTNPLKSSPVTRWVHRRAARVVAISHAVETVLREYDPRLCPMTVPSSASGLSVDPGRGEEIRRALGGDFVIGHIGAMVDRHKGQSVLIEAFKRLIVEDAGLRLLLVGGGEDEAWLRRRAENIPEIHFAGQVQSVGDYLAAMDIFAFPSRHEGLGSILLDVMQAGVPIVASEVGGIPELVMNGRNGWLVPAADPAALAEAISLLRRDPGWRRRMGEQGRRLALDYLPEAMARRYLDIYREILAE